MIEKTAIDRRSFVRSGVAVAGLAVAGTLEVASAQADETLPDWMPETWDYECDVLVIGYGGAGQWAALTAADPEEGASQVLVLEKAPVRGGGNSSINLGEFAVPTNADGAFEYIRSFTMGKTPEPVIRAWCDEAVRNGEYADKWGLPWERLAGSLASGGTASCEYPYLPGADAMGVGSVPGKGMQTFEILDDARRGLDVEVLFSCHDEELIQNPQTKEILGCWTLVGDDPEPKAVKARKGVVLTLGGFEFNEELKDKYLPVERARGFYGWRFNTGDGIPMVQKVGAQLWHMELFTGGTTANFDEPDFPSALWVAAPTSSFIWVTQQGKRFVNECGMAANSPHNGCREFFHFNPEICDFDCAPLWVIIDQATFDSGPLGDCGAEWSWGLLAPGLPEECGAFEGWSADNKAELERGWIRTGATVAELAEQIAKTSPTMTAEVLQATVDEYNACCVAGEDPKFGRDPSLMTPLGDGPYYAWPQYPGGCSTMGGPEHNEKGQVLDVSGNVIPRLYSGGSFGNMAGHTYGITGGNNAENMVWGRIGARNAAAETPWDQ